MQRSTPKRVKGGFIAKAIAILKKAIVSAPRKESQSARRRLFAVQCVCCGSQSPPGSLANSLAVARKLRKQSLGQAAVFVAPHQKQRGLLGSGWHKCDLDKLRHAICSN